MEARAAEELKQGDPVVLVSAIKPETLKQIVDVLQHVYNGGYSSKQQRLTFEDRKALRAKAYRGLKALGVEK